LYFSELEAKTWATGVKNRESVFCQLHEAKWLTAYHTIRLPCAGTVQQRSNHVVVRQELSGMSTEPWGVQSSSTLGGAAVSMPLVPTHAATATTAGAAIVTDDATVPDASTKVARLTAWRSYIASELQHLKDFIPMHAAQLEELNRTMEASTRDIEAKLLAPAAANGAQPTGKKLTTVQAELGDARRKGDLLVWLIVVCVLQQVAEPLPLPWVLGPGLTGKEVLRGPLRLLRTELSPQVRS
jgi:hypothetical protein